MGASYRHGVRWIAENDEPGSLDLDEVEGYISTLLLADLFGKEPIDVAAAVVRARRRLLKDEEPADRYVVTENTPGYLPNDDDPATFSTLGAARAYARGEVERLRDHHAEVGDKSRVRVDSSSSPRSWYVTTGRKYDLGRVIEIHDIVEPVN